MKKILLIVAALWPAFSLPALAAPQDLGIAAVVGGDAISSYDVGNRIRFIIATARLSGTPDVIERIRPQVIRSLINEKLQLQEAAKNKITISDEDIAKAIAGIEAQRNMPPGTIDNILSANNVPKTTFTDQIHAQLAWNKLLMRKIRPQVRVSDEEVELAGRRAAPAPAVRQELKIAAIALPVESPAREAEMRKLGDKLVKEVRGGASFEEVSRQFSSAAANTGGKVESFWITPEQLDPNVARALAGAATGTITDPVRTAQGFTIVKVYDTRALGGSEPAKGIEVQFKEILLKLKEDADNKEAGVLLQIGEEVAKHPGSCTEKGVAGIDNPEIVDITVDFRRSMLADLPPALKIIAENLKVGDISTPFASDEGIRLYMLCDKKQAAAPPPDKDRVYGMLIQQKMELEAQKYLRNLQREAYIDVR